MSYIRQFFARLIAFPAALVLMSGCGMFGGDGSKTETQPIQSVVKSVAGAVVGDEPQAVVEARNILAQGGTAADGAVTMYFTLSATLPSSASLGGGGICLIYDAKTGKVEALDFLARAPAVIPAGTDRPIAVPGNPMGFSILHARHGRLPWSQLVAPGERIARFGAPIARSLLTDFSPVAAPLLQDAESRRVFADATGRPVTEGATVTQANLARVLSALRTGGGAEFYRGALAREFVAAAKAAGGAIEASDLDSFRADWRQSIPVAYDSRVAHFAPPPAVAGAVAAQMFAMIEDRGRFGSGANADRLHTLAETGLRAFADRARWMREDYSSSESLGALVSDAAIGRLMRGFDPQRHTAASAFSPALEARPENPSATSFVVTDRSGSTVACTLTMNNSFGTGRMARGMGIMLAAAPNSQGRGPSALGPMIVMNENSKQMFFAAGASGGIAAPTALIGVAARALLANEPLQTALRTARIHHGGAPDMTYVEPETSREDVAYLVSRGHSVATTPKLGLVNAVSCTVGMPRDKDSCAVAADPRGHGIGMFVSE